MDRGVVGLNHSIDHPHRTHTHLCVGGRRGGMVALCRHGGAASRNMDNAGGRTCSKSSISVQSTPMCRPADPDKKGAAGSDTSSSSRTWISPKSWLIFFYLFICSPPIMDSDSASFWELASWDMGDQQGRQHSRAVAMMHLLGKIPNTFFLHVHLINCVDI